MNTLEQAVESACKRIAPTWPLDRFIAVNPFWEMVDQPVSSVGATLASLAGARLSMPRSWYLEEWRSGRLRDEHLEAAILEAKAAVTLADLHQLMHAAEPELPRRARVMDVADSGRDLDREVAWRDFIVQSTSQFCAAYFDDGQALVGPSREGGLYASWRRNALRDLSPSLLMGFERPSKLADHVPTDAAAMISTALEELRVPLDQCEAYFTSLLLDVNGWAAWCAYLGWTARLSGGTDQHMMELLAVRLAWEWMLLRSGGRALAIGWDQAKAAWGGIDALVAAARTNDWLLQRAIEIGWQRDLCSRLSAIPTAARAAPPPTTQVAFCIDVRSEIVRRAVEAQSESVQTLGFAGFFGLPVEYQPLAATRAHPQLPGLLAPRLRIVDTDAPPRLADRRTDALRREDVWSRFKSSPISGFAFVESLGLLFGAKLATDSLGLVSEDRAGLSRTDAARCKPRLSSRADGTPLDIQERADLAEKILRGMSLTRGLARLVVLVGHGSRTQNNPHASGLDCGACCGQTGEANARAAAALLDEPGVRAALALRGIEIPATTWFLPGLHDTTTDRITLHDLDDAPPSHAPDIAALHAMLERASAAARQERSQRHGLGLHSRRSLEAAAEDRAADWAQVRPEWGLANNAAMIAARRSLTRDVDLEGRVFLHDYRFEEDEDFSVLELIMTAPMVVAHWINFQYYASTVDNLRYGSGNKVLHNVVGGHLGVFEGNGGDLRIGLPLQSLHDGRRWIHTPLRLSVFIEAPAKAIEDILAKHERVRCLVDNAWIHLFRLEDGARTIHAYRDDRWSLVGHGT